MLVRFKKISQTHSSDSQLQTNKAEANEKRYRRANETRREENKGNNTINNRVEYFRSSQR